MGAYSALIPADARPLLWVLLESLAQVFFMLLTPGLTFSRDISWMTGLTLPGSTSLSAGMTEKEMSLAPCVLSFSAKLMVEWKLWQAVSNL